MPSGPFLALLSPLLRHEQQLSISLHSLGAGCQLGVTHGKKTVAKWRAGGEEKQGIPQVPHDSFVSNLQLLLTPALTYRVGVWGNQGKERHSAALRPAVWSWGRIVRQENYLAVERDTETDI